MTFDVNYNVGPAVSFLRDLRQRVAAIRGPVFEKAQGELRDKVEEIVKSDVAIAPGPAIHPFAFKSKNSMIKYLVLKRTGLLPGQTWDNAGGQYDRTQNLETSWKVDVNVSANEAFMTIGNDAIDPLGRSYSQAVYGPDAVEGFIETGWGAQIDDAISRIADTVESDLGDALERAFTAFGGDYGE